MLALIAPDLAEREVFCCGPAPYMTAVRKILGDIGFDMLQYHEESFSFEDLVAREFAPITTAPDGNEQVTTSYTVEFVRSGATLPLAVRA